MNIFENTSKQPKGVASSVWLTLARKKKGLLMFTPFTGLIKSICLNKSKYSSGFAPFKHGKKNKLSEDISPLF